jgi:hypothetical protein
MQSTPVEAKGTMLMTRKTLVLSCLPVLMAFLAIPAAAEIGPDSGRTRRVFDILRDGTPIGTNTIDIDRRDDALTVNIATKISVSVMLIEAYRYEQTCTETWKSGRLVGFKSRTNDNGKRHAIDVTQKHDKLTMEADGKRRELALTLAPASLWTKDMIARKELFEPATGRKLDIKVTDLGDESLVVKGVTYTTKHYRISAKSGDDFDRDLWFDGEKLVRMKLMGSDRSTIISDLRPVP